MSFRSSFSSIFNKQVVIIYQIYSIIGSKLNMLFKITCITFGLRGSMVRVSSLLIPHPPGLVGWLVKELRCDMKKICNCNTIGENWDDSVDYSHFSHSFLSLPFQNIPTSLSFIISATKNNHQVWVLRPVILSTWANILPICRVCTWTLEISFSTKGYIQEVCWNFSILSHFGMAVLFCGCSC